MIDDRLVEDLVFPFPLDEHTVHADQPLIYRPWGTRSLKLKVTANRDMPELRILPQAILPEDRALGIYKAYADDSRALHITWGGGHEDGPYVKARDMLSAVETCAPLKANDCSYLYFNLTHTGMAMPPAEITLRALRFPGQGPGVDAEATLRLEACPPPNLPPAEDIVRLLPVDTHGSWAVSSGRYLPRYDSRWWPSPEVLYESGEPPPLSLRVDDRALIVAWGRLENTIAVIEDHRAFRAADGRVHGGGAVRL